MSQTIVFTGIGATLLGVKKWTASAEPGKTTAGTISNTAEIPVINTEDNTQDTIYYDKDPFDTPI